MNDLQPKVGDIIEYDHPTLGACLVYVLKPCYIQGRLFDRVSQYKNGENAWAIEKLSKQIIRIIDEAI